MRDSYFEFKSAVAADHISSSSSITSATFVYSTASCASTASWASTAGVLIFSSSFLKEMSTEYYNCVVKVNIDKASGRVTHANYSTPLYMNIVVDMFGTHKALMGVTFEKDYTIEY